MPSSKFGSKFFGEERYQQYVDELTAEGTLGGEQLSPEERKEGFKKRNNKIGFEEFVNKILEKKSAATTMAANKASLPGGVGGGGGGALVKAPKGGLVKADVSKIVPDESSNILEDILKIVTSIRDTLIEKNKFESDQSKKSKQSAERERRAGKEKKLESGAFKGLKKATEKVLAPVKSLFEKVFDFIKTVILGRIVYKIVEWMGNPDNQGKIESIIRFFSDWWPVIAGAYLLFGTKFGKLIRTIGSWAIQIARFAIPKLLRFISRNPRTAAVLAGAGYLGARILTGTEVGGDEEGSSEQETAQFQKDQASAKQVEGATPSTSEEKPKEMSAGGRVPGSGNRDTVPAMLTPGEFVMSKGAVAKFGTGTLASMNAMGGGTNIPSFTGGGVLGYSNGGSVPSGDEDKDRRGPLSWVRNLFSGGTTAKKSVDDKGGDTKGGISKNAKALLNTIRWAEGTLKPGGYNTWFGGRTDMDLTKMTINQVVAEQKKRLSSGQATYGSYTSAAVGAYQMMKPEAFAARAGLNPATDKFTPENQDKMAIAGYMMGQAGMSQAEIDAPISRQQIAKIAPVWASLPMMNGASRYGQPVKRYEDLANVYNKNLQGLDPNSYSATTTIAGTGPGGTGPGGSGPSGESTPPPFDPVAAAKATKTFDYMSVREALGVKTASISKSSRPSSSTSAYNQTQNTQQGQQGQQKMEQKQTPGIPSFDAAAMSSPKKIKVLGITV